MSEMPSMRRWYKCLFRMCDYYQLYLGLIGPRLTHDEYHKAMQKALEHIADCPHCTAIPLEPCEVYAEWQQVWKLE
jgi:hypothetical protein